jgi:anthranilate synthase component 1
MRRVVGITEFIADGITPIAAFRRASEVRPGPAFLFESSPGPSRTSRYSIIGLGALGELRATDGAVELVAGGARETFGADGVLDAARSLLSRFTPDGEAPGTWGRFLGAFGAAAFEFAGYLERIPQLGRDDDPMPDLHLVVPEAVVIFDHFTHRLAVLSMPDLEGRVRDDADLVDAIARATIEPIAVRAGHRAAGRAVAPDARSARFIEAVDEAKEAIAAGEIFQVVLSQRWVMPGAARAFDAYRVLRSINPSPYMFYLDLGWGPLFGSSPEALVRLDGRRASLRPLAGTKPRHQDPDEERRIAARLRRDPKERAEHVMLVDLGRNDLGRVCAAGTVGVDEFLKVERFSHVMHLTSEVSGELRSDRDAFDLFAGAFPAGTVSGAPKIRAMEIIAQLEARRRGFYAGCVGYFGFDGSMDACITLRSAHAYDGRLHVAAGAGIVADSRADAEDAECRAKAGAVLEAVAAVDGVAS